MRHTFVLKTHDADETTNLIRKAARHERRRQKREALNAAVPPKRKRLCKCFTPKISYRNT
jgi:ERCC4-type nuclease